MTDIKIIKNRISQAELKKIAEKSFGDIIKGAVDVKRRVAAFGGEFHVDANEALLEDGSEQQNIWGINILLTKPKEQWLEFNSLINIKPAFNNRSMGIEDEATRKQIKEIINELIE